MSVIIVPGPGNRKSFGCFVVDSRAGTRFRIRERRNAFPSTSTTKTAVTAGRTSPIGRSSSSATHYKDKKIDKWDIFHYVYGLLHHPGYREKFADNLKRELPRIPFAPDFRAFAEAGKKLAELHLDYEKLKPWDLDFVETPGVPLSYRVEDKMRLSKDKTRLSVNPSLTLAGIPPAAFDYRLGNRSALEWVDRPVPGQHRRTQRHHFRPQPRRRPGVHRPARRPGHPRESWRR